MTFLKALKPPHRHVAGMVLQLALYCVLCMGNTRESRVALPREIHLQHPQEQRYLFLPLRSINIFVCPQNGMAASVWDF